MPVLVREEVCDRCYGDGKVWEEATEYSGAGYGRCSHCEGKGKINNTIILSNEEVIKLYNEIDKDKKNGK